MYSCSPSSFFLILPRPPPSTLFPYTTLFRSRGGQPVRPHRSAGVHLAQQLRRSCQVEAPCPLNQVREPLDRKSTRLNSSHGYISYAVFCLKKKSIFFSPSATAATSPRLSAAT